MQRVYSLVNIGNSFFSQQFLCCLEELSHEKRWHGKRLPIKFQLFENNTQIKITTKLLSDEIVEGLFIAHSINFYESNIRYENVLSDDFNKLFLLCSLKDLLENPIARSIINGYRMMMNYQDRSNDVYLCLVDNDSVLTYGNEKDEEQLQLDFFQLLDEKEHEYFRLSDKSKVLLSELELQDFGQYTIPVPYHHSKVVKICENLFVHMQANKRSGYIELAQVTLNDLLEPLCYKINKFSRNQNYNYMFNIMSLVKKIFSSKPTQANIAVVGTPAAGKTLLINDMMTAMKRMGYSPGGPYQYTSIGNLRYDISDNAKTPNYAMRNTYIYDSVYSFGDSSLKKINFTFVNIPGEIFDRDRLEICANIYKAIYDVKSNKFTKRVIELDNGQNETFLEYQSISREKLLTRNDNSKVNIKNRTSYLPTVDNFSYHNIFQENYDKTYAKGRTSKVNGREVLKEYFSYDTDSVVNAIYDAWTALIANVPISKEQFFTDYSRDLSFHMYLQMATDMVICEKLIDKNGITNKEDSELQSMLEGIRTYCKKTTSKLNFYVAFRAVDIALDNTKLRNICNEIMKLPAINRHYGSAKIIRLSNALYSYFIYSMSKKDDIVNNDIYNIDNVIYNEETDSFLSDVDMINQLRQLQEHVACALSICDVEIPGIINNTRSYLSSHVYYTATPIDEDAEIYVNTSTEDSIAKFSHFSQGRSICFGSMQLCIDILKHHNRFIYENDDTYGMILDSIIK